MRAIGWLVLFLALGPGPALAESVVATRTLRAHTLIGPDDVALAQRAVAPGAAAHPDQVVGLEARVTLYSGRPIPLSALGPPALVERNQVVTLVFQRGGLEIRAEGRALGRGGEGDAIRIMNLASRNTVTGWVTETGEVHVAP
jgi:flagellar basal body P-ring formation protein FlgA